MEVDHEPRPHGASLMELASEVRMCVKEKGKEKQGSKLEKEGEETDGLMRQR